MDRCNHVWTLPTWYRVGKRKRRTWGEQCRYCHLVRWHPESSPFRWHYGEIHKTKFADGEQDSAGDGEHKIEYAPGGKYRVCVKCGMLGPFFNGPCVPRHSAGDGKAKT